MGLGAGHDVDSDVQLFVWILMTSILEIILVGQGQYRVAYLSVVRKFSQDVNLALALIDVIDVDDKQQGPHHRALWDPRQHSSPGGHFAIKNCAL